MEKEYNKTRAVLLGTARKGNTIVSVHIATPLGHLETTGPFQIIFLSRLATIIQFWSNPATFQSWSPYPNLACIVGAYCCRMIGKGGQR